MTPAIAPEAPTIGTVEPGAGSTWASAAGMPQAR